MGCSTDAELFGVVLAAVIHDFDHPGVNNAFMINSKSDIAIRYNDISVLENHHLAASFAIMLQEDCNIFSNCTDEVYKEGTVLSERFSFCLSLTFAPISALHYHPLRARDGLWQAL